MSKKRAAQAASFAVPALQYVGNGAWIRGIPARDLSADEVARLDSAALIGSGLYTEAASAPAADEEPSADSGEELDSDG
jgi:hypothetical protein